MLPETAVSSFSSGSFQIRLLMWQVAGLLSWNCCFLVCFRHPLETSFQITRGWCECWPEALWAPLLVSTPVLGGKNVNQKPMTGSLVGFW